jgi:hypothetical protein
MPRPRTDGEGPGLGDLTRTMMALEEQHQVSVALTYLLRADVPYGGVWIAMATPTGSLRQPATVGDNRLWVTEYVVRSPDTAATFSKLYGLLLSLDVLLSNERWGQQTLPGVA